ncbi:MAG: EAL domain-containing protein, partial [Nocardioidaceae bacterium]
MSSDLVEPGPSADPASAPVGDLARVLREGLVVSHFQPIIDLDSGGVAAFEALARGPVGPLASPMALFSRAREEARLAELDEACRAAAFRGAVEHRLVAPLSLFVNVEPEVLERAPLDRLLAIAEGSPAPLRVVLEITERALATRPAELLRAVERVRELGWGIALDDVGAEPASLAFMPVLRPDVVKLDLRLVQGRPTPEVAEVMNAVNAYAERSGALVLAEGIETEAHLSAARALGATLGQGWMFGRPSPRPVVERVQPLALPVASPGAPYSCARSSVFACLPADIPLRRAPKRLLVELSKQLEREAMRTGETCVVAATFQEAHQLTPATVQRYRDLADRVGFVCALGEGLGEHPVPGVRGAGIDRDDPIRGEWDVAVLSPHFTAALLARDLGDTGPEMSRRFEYALTYDRDTVVDACRGLLARVAPRTPAPGEPPVAAPAVPGPGTSTRAAVVTEQIDNPTLRRALQSATSGVTIADVTRPDQPLVFVNRAFETLSGFPAAQLLGRNCRFLQGPDTDRAAVARIRAAVREGRECRELLLNVRGPRRQPWWNEVRLSPVTDSSGVVVQYIGVQTDVTERVEAQRALQLEAERSRSYLARIEQLAYTDALTGLMNRRRLEESVETELWEARAADTALALLFLDLDGFKAVNDSLG